MTMLMAHGDEDDDNDGYGDDDDDDDGKRTCLYQTRICDAWLETWEHNIEPFICDFLCVNMKIYVYFLSCH